MQKKILGILVVTLLIATSFSITTVADWDPEDGHKMHFPQLPDPNGWDVHATAPIELADDWRCSETGYVKDIHFWGSWLGDNKGVITSFNIAIYTSNPGPPSKPKDLKWEREIVDWVERGPDSGDQGWYWPENDEYLWHDHQLYYQYNVFLEEPWFLQEEGTIYWLVISANVARGTWGWKSSKNHYMDDAVWRAPGGDWKEMYEPQPPITNQFWAQVNPNGYLEEGGGTDAYLNKWWYYENTEWWNIWFYDHPFDPEKYKEITIEFDFNPGPAGQGWALIALNWATPYWEPGGPPPVPPLNPQEEEMYVARQVLAEIVEPGHYVFDFTILDYNPEWVSVDIMGMDFDITGIITHQCLPPGPGSQSLDLAFVITGEEGGEPSIDIDKKVSKDGGITWSDEVDVELDDTVRFKITVENNGDVDLNYIKIIDTLPSCLEYADNADPVEPIISGNKLTWIYTYLNAGQKKEIEFDAKAIETGENINEVSVTTLEEVSDSSTATVNVGEIPVPKIGCEGELKWSGTKPNSTVTGTIYAKNIGDPGSKLKWKVCGNPSWGTWNFNPPSGTDLKPSDGLKAIDVTVVAPNQQNQQFSGQITLCNEEDSTDTCTIQVSLATPKNKPYLNTPLLKFLESHPYMFPLLRQLLEL